MKISQLRLPSSLVGFAVLMLFALPFALIGSTMLFVALKTVISSNAIKAWPTVPGTLTSLGLKSESKSEKVVATYSYFINEKEYSGKKASLYGADNIGSFHKGSFTELQNYFSRHEPFPVHVNPSDPTDSILLPTLRWGIIAFDLLFVVLFGGAGWGLLVVCFLGIRRLKIEDKLKAQYPNEPWKHKMEWATSRIKSSIGSSAIGAVVAAVMWNAFSSPILIAIPDKLKAGEYLILIALVFPLFGIGLIIWATASVLRAVRFGKAYLELETYPGRQGDRFRARLIAPQALGEASQVQLQFCCQKNTDVASGNKGGTYTKEEKVWKLDAKPQVVKGQSATGEVIVQVDFPIPPQLPDSSFDRNPSYTWILTANAELTGADFAAEFEVPVFKAFAQTN